MSITLCLCIHTMSTHSIYLVSDLEGSDNGPRRHSCWNEPSVFALKLRRPARSFYLPAQPGTRPVLGSQCPSPEALVRGTTEHAETHISGPDARAAPVSAHGPDVSQCPSPEGLGPLAACRPQFLTRRLSRPPISCVCLCGAGPAISVPAVGVLPPVCPAPDCMPALQTQAQCGLRPSHP